MNGFKLFSVCLFIMWANILIAGDYDARKNEVLKELEDLKLTDKVLKKYKGQISGYFSYRESMLKNAFKFLKEKSPDNPQVDDWESHFGKASEEALKRISVIVNNKETSEIVADYFSKVASAESAFFKAIQKMPLPAMRDQNTQHLKTFREEQKKLKEKWKQMGYLDKSIDSQVQKTQKELQKLYEDSKQKVANNVQYLEKHLRDLVKVAASLPSNVTQHSQLLSYAKQIATTVTPIMDTLKAMDTKTEAIKRMFDSLYKREETVIIMFGDTRTSVKKFLEKVNFNIVAQQYKDSTSKSTSIAQSRPGKQREDAEKFVGQAIQILKGHLDAFEDQYKKFVNEFDHIFLGPVGNQTIDELLERNQWEKWSDDVERINIGEFLDKLYDDANDWWGISLSNLDPHEKEAVRELIEKDLEKLEEKAKSAKGFSFIERFKLLIPNRKKLEEKSKK